MPSCLLCVCVCVCEGVVFSKPKAVFSAVIHVYADCKIVSRISQIAAKHCSALEIMIL